MKRIHSTLILSALIAPLSLTWSPSTAQTFEELLKQKYVTALQDSAVKFELIKPRMVTLQKSFGFIQQENQALKNERRILSFQHQALKINFETSLADQRRKTKGWVIAAFVAGAFLGAITF